MFCFKSRHLYNPILNNIGRKSTHKLFFRFTANTKNKTTNTNKTNSIYKLVKELVLPHIKTIGIASTGLIVSTGVSIAIPASFGHIIDCINEEHIDYKIYGLGLGCLFLVGALGSFVRNYFFSLASESIIFSLRRRLFRAVIQKPIKFHEKARVGELVSRLNSDVYVVGRSFAGDNLSSGLRNFSQLIAAFGIMTYLSPKLTLTISLLLPIAFFTSRFYGIQVRSLSKGIQKELANSVSIAEESFRNIRTVKGFNKEDFEELKYAGGTRKIFNVSMKYARAASLFFSTTALVGNASMTAMLLYGAHLVSIDEITVGILTSFLFYAVYVGYSGVNIASFFAEFMKGHGAAVRIMELLGDEKEWKIKTSRQCQDYWTEGIPLKNDLSALSLEGISFSYSDSASRHVLEEVNFEFEAGKKYAIIGPSGAGKSTIISIISHFYSPQKGKICFNGKTICSMSEKWVRSHLGIVSQDVELFTGTVLENILYGTELFNNKNGETGCYETQTIPSQLRIKAEKAARMAHAHNFISRLPKGYDTILGEKGSSLSGGEKQRVAFARAIAKDPSVFLFDEVTSALDPINEKLILDAIDNIRGKITILVTHSLKLAKRSDIVLYIDKGKITNVGHPSNLPDKLPDFYAELDS